MENRNSYLFLICVSLLVFITACAPSRTEIWLNKNDSGKIELTFDLGEMTDMVQGMMESEGDDGEERDDWADEEAMDSTFTMYGAMPDSVRQSISNAELLDQVVVNIKIQPEEEVALMSMAVSFDDREQLEEILSKIDESTKDGGAGMMGAGGSEGMSDMFETFDADMKNGIIRLEGIDLEELKNDPDMADMFAQMEDPETANDPEFMMFMEMMFGNDSEFIVHAPGKIEFTNDPNAEVNGNTAIFRDKFLEVVKSGKSNAKIIKFKK